MATKLPYVLPFEDGSVVAAILLKAQGLPETEQIATKTELQQATAYLATLDNSTMAPQSATVKRTTDNLQTQINNIVRAPESGGDVGAEVAQARVGVNGTNYQTLKARLDAENEDINANFLHKTVGINTMGIEDLNDLPVNKSCTWGTADTVANVPDNQTAGFAACYGFTQKYQIAFGYASKKYYFRTYYNNSWQSWKTVVGTEPGENILTDSSITQTSGSSTSTVMSQKAVSDALLSLETDIEAVETSIDDFTVDSSNLFDISTVVAGGYYNSSGNITQSTNGEYSTQYISVEPETVYSFTRTGSQMVYCEYDENKTFLRRTAIQDTSTIKFTTSNDAYFVRLSLYGSFGFSNDFVFNKGDEVLPFEPYGKAVDYDRIKGKPIVQHSYIRYEVGAGVEPERVYIYIPINNGYLKYTFVHSVNSEINADVWRIKNAITTDLTFTDQTQLTVGGEWECAIMLQGRRDFMGGINHGDETYDSVEFIIDGKLTDVSTLTSRTEFSTLRIVQNSNLYDPNDSTTLVATHGSEHIFGPELEINQTINWKTAETVSIAYLAMMLMSKSVVDTLYTDADYSPIDLSERTNYSFDVDSVKKISQYSAATGVYAELECDMEKTATFKDNNGQNYHKCYFDYVSGNTTVENGTLWKNKSVYRYEIKNPAI